MSLMRDWCAVLLFQHLTKSSGVLGTDFSAPALIRRSGLVTLVRKSGVVCLGALSKPRLSK